MLAFIKGAMMINQTVVLIRFIRLAAEKSSEMLGICFEPNELFFQQTNDNGSLPAKSGDIILSFYSKLRSNGSADISSLLPALSTIPKSQLFEFMMRLRRENILIIKDAGGVDNYFDELVSVDAMVLDEYEVSGDTGESGRGQSLGLRA